MRKLGGKAKSSSTGFDFVPTAFQLPGGGASLDRFLDAGSNSSRSPIFEVIHGTPDADILHGGNGHDIIFGDGPAKYEQRVLDFMATSTWSGVPQGATEMDLPMLTVRSTNGSLASYYGAGIVSPSDSGNQRWTFEIDSYNDQPEILHLDFEKPQTEIVLTMNLLYKEPILLTEAEKVVMTVRFSDGSTATAGVAASPTGGPLGEASITLSASSFGGRKIVGVDLQADPALPVVPPAYEAQYGESYNATHPFSEFTLKSVAYTRDVSRDEGNDDVLCGGNGKDMLWGGRGDDYLFGGNGSDLLAGGSGNNQMSGGNGPDVFLFGVDSTGSNLVTDWERGTDTLVFAGVNATAWEVEGRNGVLSLSSGGEIVFAGITSLGDISIINL